MMTFRYGLWSRFFLLMVASAMVASCGMYDEPAAQNDFGPQWEARRSQLTDFCSVKVDGYGTVGVEDDYVAKVVACEDGGASLEALKAQAIAARGYAKYITQVERRALSPSTRDQKYDCGRTPSAAVRQAVKETSGMVLTHNGKIVLPFFFAGSTHVNSNTCMASGSSGTQKYVTYNHGLIGGQVHTVPRPMANPNSPANRGGMSQNGANCLANNGWKVDRILRFFYGDDIRITQLPGACVDHSGGSTGGSSSGDPTTCGNGWVSGNATQFGYNDPVDNGMGAFGDNTDNTTLAGVSLPESVVTAELGTSSGTAARHTNVLVVAPNGNWGVFPIVDRGPAMRIYNQTPTIDLTYATVAQLGYTPSNDSSSFRVSGIRWNILTDQDSDCPTTSGTNSGAGDPSNDGSTFDPGNTDTSGNTDTGGTTCDSNAAQPHIIPRSAWGAQPPKYNRSHHTPKMFTIHHTLTSNHDTNPKATIRQLQREALSRGWADIGDHYLIDQQGRIYAGNPVDRMGAHVAGHNKGNIGIDFLGDYSSLQPTEAQLAAAGKLIRYVANKYHITVGASTVKGHRDLASTSCPGNNLYSKVGRIIRYAKGEDMGCSDGSTTTGNPPPYQYVRVRATSDVPLGDNDTVEGYELDSVFVTTADGSKHMASSVTSSSMTSNASAVTGAPDNDSCDNRSSTVAGIQTTGEVVVKNRRRLLVGRRRSRGAGQLQRRAQRLCPQRRRSDRGVQGRLLLAGARRGRQRQRRTAGVAVEYPDHPSHRRQHRGPDRTDRGQRLARHRQREVRGRRRLQPGFEHPGAAFPDQLHLPIHA